MIGGYGVGKGGSGGGGGTPSAPENSVQFNNAGAFGGSANFTYDPDTGNFLVADESGNKFISIDTNTGDMSFGDYEGVSTGAGLLSFEASGLGTLQATNLNVSCASGYISLGGTTLLRISSVAYGGIRNVGAGFSSVVFTTGTGAATLNLGETFPAQSILIVSDLDRISSTSNITIDAGVGNTITDQAGSSQTLVLATDGISVTLQKATSTKWMVISTN